jgi:hypothetical protein
MWEWVKRNSLWLVGLGLMLSSSGLDGVYISRWMTGAPWLGFVLNTMSDVANLTLMYWYGRFRQSPKGSKRYRLAGAMLPSEIIAALYSWLFSWRQLRAVLPAVEPEHWRWVAPVAAGFIPLLLAFVGYAQSLLAGKLDDEPSRASDKPAAQPQPSYACQLCSRAFGSQQALNGHMRAHNGNRSNGKRESSEIITTKGDDGNGQAVLV